MRMTRPVLLVLLMVTRHNFMSTIQMYECLKASDEPLESDQALLLLGKLQNNVSVIPNNQVVVVVGESGTRNTTQLPQYLHEDGYMKNGKQPELKNHVGVGGYDYPAFIPLNIKNGAYAPLKSAFEGEQIILYCASEDTFTNGSVKCTMTSMTASEPVVSLAVSPFSKDSGNNIVNCFVFLTYHVFLQVRLLLEEILWDKKYDMDLYRCKDVLSIFNFVEIHSVQALQERPQGALPSNTVANPREDVKVITTLSGITLAGPSAPPPNPRSSFEELFKKLHFNISLVKALALMPKYAKILKDLHTNKEKLLEMGNTPLNENCSAVILKKLPEKLGDPGKFLIPCDFSEFEACMALADLGASINIMPLSVWKNLMLPELVPTRMTLELASRSVAYPAGIAKDVFVQVGKFMFLADFVVVDYDVDLRVPLILRRPFLRTANALVDVHGEELIMRVGDEKMTFKVDSTLKYSHKYGKESINMIDIFDTTCDDHFHRVLKFQKSIHPLSGNPTPFSDLVVASLSPSLTPFRDSEFLLEETDILLSHFDHSLPDYEAFCFDISIIKKRRVVASNSHHEEFADEIAHIISPPEYDHFYFDIEADPGELTRLLIENLLRCVRGKEDDRISRDRREDDELKSKTSTKELTIHELNAIRRGQKDLMLVVGSEPCCSIAGCATWQPEPTPDPTPDVVVDVSKWVLLANVAADVTAGQSVTATWHSYLACTRSAEKTSRRVTWRAMIGGKMNLAAVNDEPVLVDEDEDPKEEEFEEKEEPQEEEEYMEVDIEEDENEPELTYSYEEVDPLNPLSPASESEPEDVIRVEDTVKSEDETVPASVYAMVSLSRRLCGHETAHALVEKKGKAKDEYYGKLILDLVNEVRSSVEQGTTAMEKLVEKLGNAEEKAECKKFMKELEKARGFMFEERPNEAIDVLVEDEKSPSSEARGSPQEVRIFKVTRV
ncbi:reverse transcriptase domain-containing protein [Tanacetum coccineum]